MFVTSVLSILICASCTIAGVHGSERQAVEYIFNTNPASWNQAQEYCEKLGSRLVTFTTEDKFKTFVDVYQEVRESNRLFGDLWIGLYDSKPPKGQYIWTDCTCLSSFTNWNEKEPNAQKTERCIRLVGSRLTWRTRQCNHGYVFTCERLLHSCWFDDQVGRTLKSWKTILPNSSLDECKSLCSSDMTCGALSYVDDTCFHGDAADVILNSNSHALSSSKVCQRYIITNENFTDESPVQDTSNHKCDDSNESISCPIEGTTTMSSVSDSSIGTVHLNTHSQISTTSIAVTGTSRESTISEERYISETLFVGLSSIETNEELIQTSFKSPGEEKASSTESIYENTGTSMALSSVYPYIPTTKSTLSTVSPSYTSTERNSASTPANAGKDIGQSVERSVTVKCTCVCKTSPKAVEDKVAKISKELTLNKTALSCHKRKLTSAPDQRTSATVSGVLGLTIMVAAAIFAIFLDVNRVFIWIKRQRPQLTNS